MVYTQNSLKENSIFVKIFDKKFLISDIVIDESGKVSYQIYSLSEISDNDKKYISDFIYKMITGEFNEVNRRKNYT